jgi:hypothetical protein
MLKKLDVEMNDTANTVLSLVFMTVCDPDGTFRRKNVDLFMDNRFAQPRLLVVLLAALHVYCTCTIRMNFFPLHKALRAAMIPEGWEKKSITEENKKTFRDLAANLCSFMCLTMVICFDQGLCKMVTSRQGMDQQKRHENHKQRRSFLDIITRIKKALCRLYTDHMDGVDIEDHHRVMNSEILATIRTHTTHSLTLSI